MDTVTDDLIPLDGAADHAVVGGKAAGIDRLRAAGLPAPEGVVVPAGADDRHLDALAAALHARLGAASYAVRSSAAVEDGDADSFAGVFETELDVPSERLAASIARVRASGGGERVGAYVGHGVGRIPVLVMPMAPHAAAGVAFTVDPVTGDDRAVLVSAATGRGDRVVNGEVTPTEYRVAGHRVEIAGSSRPLTDGTARRVADLARRCESVVGGPADVEFAVGPDGGVTLLQARPITALPVDHEGDPVTGTWIREVSHFAHPPSTLFATAYIRLENEAFTRYLAEIGAPLARLEHRVIDGYAYLRTTPVGAPPDGSATTPPTPLLKLITRVHPEYRRRARRARRHVAGGGIEQAVAVVTEAVERWEARPPVVTAVQDLDDRALARWLDARLDDLAEVVDLHFREAITAGMPAGGRFGVRAAELLGFAPWESMHLLRGHGRGTVQLADDLADTAAAVQADPDAVALLDGGDDPADVLARLADRSGPSGEAIRALLARYRDVVVGYDLDAPTLGEQPEELLAGLRHAMHRDEDDDETRRLLAAVDAHPEAAQLHRLLDVARRAHDLRDRSANLIGGVFGLLRAGLLELGRRETSAGRLDRERDVFELTEDELRGVLAAYDGPGAQPDVRQAARRRRRRREAAARRTPPHWVGAAPPSDPPDASVFPRGMRELTEWVGFFIAEAFHAPDPSDAVTGETLAGRPGSPGVHEGRVRVVTTPAGLDRVQPGDVLVCPFTNPAWTPALLRAGAVVTAAGGPLSHAAIVARELGVPCVCAVPHATEILPDGAMVAVDGAAGTVRLLDGERV